jgi:predicted RND superfamily exporter protein
MSPGTAVAVLVDALTTLVGFGSLMIATHQGLQSLGRVLTLGVTCCLFTSLVMLPAALSWMTRHRKHPLPADPRMVPEAPAQEAPQLRRAA